MKHITFRIPAALTELQRQRAEKIRACMRGGMNGAEAAACMGISYGALQNTMRALVGSQCWPGALPEKLFDLPICESPNAMFNHVRSVIGEDGETALAGAEILRRRDEVQRGHAAREQYWLEQERQRYQLPRAARPLSGMPA